MNALRLGLGTGLSLTGLFALAAACGDNARTAFAEVVTTDGNVASDASPDAPEAASPTHPLTVNVVAYGTPVANARVLFHDASGAVTADQKTDASGKITADAAPSQVTVIASSPDGQEGKLFVTYTQVTDGDVLTVDVAALAPSPSPGDLARLHVALPSRFNNSTYYDVQLTDHCSGSAAEGEPADIPVLAQCIGAENHVLAVALDAENVAKAYAWKKNLTLPAPGETTDETLGKWKAGTKLTVTATNLPTPAETWAEVTIFSGPAPFAMLGAPTGKLLESDKLEYLVPPADFTSALQVAAFATLDRDKPELATFGIVKRAPLAAASSFDFAQALPRIALPTVTTTDGRAEVAWSAARPLDGTDGGYVAISWTATQLDAGADADADVDAGVAAGKPNRWVFVVPANAVTVKAPALPADEPAPVDGTELKASVAFAESTLLPGYKELKAVPVLAGSSLDRLPIVTSPLTADGTVRFTSVGFAAP